MNLKNLIISIIIVSMLILGATMYISDMGTKFGTTPDLSGFENTQKRLGQQQNISMELNEKLNFTLETGVTALYDVPYKFIQVSWGMIKMVWNSWGTTAALITESFGIFTAFGVPLPDWLVASIISIFIISVIFVIIYLLMKWKTED